MKVLTGVLTLLASTSLSAQFFVLPYVEVHRLGISAVTRPTVMAGVPTGLGAAGWPGGLRTDPNPAAAAAVLLPGQLPLLQAGGNGVGSGVGGVQSQLPGAGQVIAAARPGRPDPAEAAARLLAYQKAQAAEGSPSAQYAMALRYRKGDGVEASPGLSKIWMEAAARHGSDEAAKELAASQSH